MADQVNFLFVSPDGYDLCVYSGCKAKTAYKTGTPVYSRQNYVEGVGQYCIIHGKADEQNTSQSCEYDKWW